jgi:GT2 family glycosyltransferase
VSATVERAAPRRVAAIVVNWNGGAANLDCLRSLLAQGLAESDIVFVDNGSRDGSRELVAHAHPALVRIDNAHNLGYGAGVNQGLARVLERGAAAVFLVNNDLELPVGTLQLLLAEFERAPAVGIVGPRVLYRHDPSRVWAAGGRLTWRQNLSTLLGHGAPDGPEYRDTREVDYVPGCALLARREVFERVGLLRAEYFAYHEDLEFCVDARAHGFGVRVVGAASALHDAGAATGGGYNPRRKYMMGVNTVWFLRRHGTPLRWLSFALFDVLSLLPLWIAGLFNGRSRAVLAKAIGTWHGLQGRKVDPGVLEPGAGPLW